MYIESINIIFFSLIDNKGLIFLKIFVHLNLKWYFIILKKKKTFNKQIQKFWIRNKMFFKTFANTYIYKIYDTFGNEIFFICTRC